MTHPVDLPSNTGDIIARLGASYVISELVAGGGSSIHGHFLPHIFIWVDNHPIDEIITGISVIFVIDNNKHLGLNSNGLRNISRKPEWRVQHITSITEDSFLERVLILIIGSACPQN